MIKVTLIDRLIYWSHSQKRCSSGIENIARRTSILPRCLAG